jgi:hypothetical protein
MLIYISSSDSLDSYPLNNPHEFTVNLSQTFYTQGKAIGLREICLTRKKVTSIDDSLEREEGDVSRSAAESESHNVYLYVMVTQCSNSECNGHRHPVLRMIGLNEFSDTSSIIRFPDVLFIPLKEHNLNRISVCIRLSPTKSSHCCIQSENLLSGETRCTFDIVDL